MAREAAVHFLPVHVMFAASCAVCAARHRNVLVLYGVCAVPAVTRRRGMELRRSGSPLWPLAGVAESSVKIKAWDAVANRRRWKACRPREAGSGCHGAVPARSAGIYRMRWKEIVTVRGPGFSQALRGDLPTLQGWPGGQLNVHGPWPWSGAVARTPWRQRSEPC